MGRDMHLIGPDLTGDGDDRGSVAVGIGDAGDEIGSSRAEGGHADAGFTRQSAVYIGHEAAPCS